MPSTIKFPFSDDEALPRIPITLSYTNSSISVNALLDSGSTVNLLPYDIGLQTSGSSRANISSRLTGSESLPSSIALIIARSSNASVIKS